MATPFNMDFNPARVMMGQNDGGSPYIGGRSNIRKPVGGPIGPSQGFIGSNPSTAPAPQPTGTLGAEAVRATGSGPFDQAFRQNLATYAGGQFQRPGGMLGFNPTGGLFGNPTGGGNDPVLGMPNDLMTMALGGQSFQFQAPQAVTPGTPRKPVQRPDWTNWLERGRGYGRYFG